MSIRQLDTTVKHSESKNAWNVIGGWGQKYKVARVPYEWDEECIVESELLKQQAKEYAEFISWCFNNINIINQFTGQTRHLPLYEVGQLSIGKYGFDIGGSKETFEHLPHGNYPLYVVREEK